MNSPAPLVSVILLTYNHEKYIEESIESILLQKCNFSFELIIGEDCSTDNTRELVLGYQNKYPDLISCITPECNVGEALNELRCLKYASGKYVAYLEGDDFWTDPYKLQKQVDFLENNPDYGLVHGDVNHLNQATGKTIFAYNKTNKINIPEGSIFNELMVPSHLIKTMTVCLRKEIFDRYYLNNTRIMYSEWRLIDLSIWLMFSLHTKIKYFNEVLATYRLLPESMSRTKDFQKLYSFHKKIYDIRFFFMKQKSVPSQLRLRIYNEYYNFLFFDGYNLHNKRMMYRGVKGLRSFDQSIKIKQLAMMLNRCILI
jgi:glycosyltransferase involved in cell wall biosynthesis